MRTRRPERGRGIHQPRWRKTKNAAFHRMRSCSFEEDPQPELPDCFRNQAYVEKLVNGLKCLKNEGFQEDTRAEPPAANDVAPKKTPPGQSLPWQPETLFRACISSLACGKEFGPMMAAEADARGFFAARKRAFLGDGLGYNWSIHRRWFADFVPIADFMHVVEYLHAAAKAIHGDAAARWRQYVSWANACWQGRADEVIAQLRVWQSQLGPPPEEEPTIPDNDPRKIVHATTRAT